MSSEYPHEHVRIGLSHLGIGGLEPELIALDRGLQTLHLELATLPRVPAPEDIERIDETVTRLEKLVVQLALRRRAVPVATAEAALGAA